MRLKKTRKILFLMIGVIYMTNTYGCAGNFKYNNYSSKDPEINITVDYIAGWLYSEQRGANNSFAQVIFYEPKGKGEISKAGITITVEKSLTPELKSQDLQTLVENLLTKRLKFKDASVLSKSKRNLLGTVAWDIELTYKTLDKFYSVDAKLIPLRERVVIFKKGDKFYTLRYQNTDEDFNKFNEAFNHIIGTLKLKDTK